jgi:hypothetical protein
MKNLALVRISARALGALRSASTAATPLCAAMLPWLPEDQTAFELSRSNTDDSHKRSSLVASSGTACNCWRGTTNDRHPARVVAEPNRSASEYL